VKKFTEKIKIIPSQKFFRSLDRYFIILWNLTIHLPSKLLYVKHSYKLKI